MGAVLVKVGVGVGVGLGLGVGVGLGLGVGVAVGDGLGLGVGVGLGFGPLSPQAMSSMENKESVMTSNNPFVLFTAFDDIGVPFTEENSNALKYAEFHVVDSIVLSCGQGEMLEVC